MTEGGWSVCVNPPTMLRFLREARKASNRKCLLLAVARARRSWDSLSPQERKGFEVAERYVEGHLCCFGGRFVQESEFCQGVYVRRERL